jgi:hypothetical protein
MLTPREQLLTGHDQFQRLVQEHSQYSQRLESLTQKRYLTEDEKLEEAKAAPQRPDAGSGATGLQALRIGQSGHRSVGPEQSGLRITIANQCRRATSLYRALLSAFFYWV